MLICPDCSRPVDDAAQCTACGWTAPEGSLQVLLSTRDQRNPLFESYQQNYDVIAEDDLEDSILPTGYLERQADLLMRYMPDLKGRDVCELGVGQGRLFRRLAAAEPRSLTGIDIAAAYLTKIREEPGMRLAVANGENLPFSEEFDVLVATDILEHVLNPADAVLSVWRALRPGGVFVTRVPYLDDLTLYARLLGCPYEFVHLRTFTKTTLVRLLRQCGFAVKRVHFDGWTADRARHWRLLARLRRRGADLARLRIMTDPTCEPSTTTGGDGAAPPGPSDGDGRPRRALALAKSYIGPERLVSLADRDLLPPRLARLFMQPAEIAAVAVKRPA